jgi:hypothetical protein
LKKLKENEPKRIASLTTFSNGVKYFADCLNREVSPCLKIHDSNDLNSKERISTHAKNLIEDLKPVSESHEALENQIKCLFAEGNRPLGPALFYSIEMPSKRPGSSIILCTDGCVNNGLRDLEENYKTNEKFYEDVANYAEEKSVVVNIVTIEDTDCKLAVLRKVSDLSNGEMTVVNTHNLSKEFVNLINNKTIATSVQVYKLH